MVNTNKEDYFGRMNDPTGSAFLEGPCGDSMEFYLTIEDDKIIEVRFYTEGCAATQSCGAVTAALAKGRTIAKALCISPGEVIENIKDLPDDHRHCSILSVSTLYRAIAEYLLKI
ncbi:MAG: iron-sulfur cluster assembly scaffold protein [bacterium]|jgi:nitrogen fixation NifU-like protein|nr:iron-sulfur cluster assembly scaffold protein [bacterium]